MVEVKVAVLWLSRLSGKQFKEKLLYEVLTTAIDNKIASITFVKEA